MSLLDTASLIVTPNGYKAGKLYSVVPSSGAGDLDVVRATTATRVNSNGLIESVASNIPRLDYTNGSCPSILVEPQRTNLVTYSSQFDNAAWSKLRSTITVNATVSPDGTQNADKIVENNEYNPHGIDSPSATVTSGTTYTASVFAKASERRYIFLALNYSSFTSGNGVCFDLQTGTIVATGTGSSSAGTIKNFGNGWYRCTITLIANATASYTALPAIYIGNEVSSILPEYAGDGTSGIYIWGAQLEAGSYATSYIPTTSASVTRNADVISKTGISSLIGQTEGTMFLDVDITTDTSNFYVLGNTIGATATDYITINTFSTTGNIYMEIVNGTQQALIISSVNSGHCKIAVAYKLNDIAFYINGNLIGTDSSATIPSTSSFGTEYETTLGNRNIKNYNAIALWKTRLTNSQLEQLTTL
jgi:hypothetical protein